MADSLSRIPICIRIIGIGDATGELNRLTAPLTVQDILNRLPISGRAIITQGCISIMIELKRGLEKPVNQVETGTIAYWPRTGSICIFPENIRPYSPVNRIGSIHKGINFFRDLKSGSRIIIEVIDNRNSLKLSRKRD